jgi:CRISPR-associated protein Csm3
LNTRPLAAGKSIKHHLFQKENIIVMKSILQKKIIFRGKIETVSGLHIGGTEAGMEIGGVNSYIVRNPSDNKPYIPGSSIKGKLRSMIELVQGQIGNEKMGQVVNGPCMDPNSNGAKLFGNMTKGDELGQRPSRIIVRDCMLQNEHNFKHADLFFAQAKTEVVLDRLTAKAMPRTIERVPQGAIFGLSIVLNIFEGENEKELVNLVLQGLRLLQDDYLGGNGSRGYGEIKINLEAVVARDPNYYLTGTGEKNLEETYPIPVTLKAKP